MPAESRLSILLASHDPSLLAAVEPMLTAAEAQVKIVFTGEAALAALASPLPPDLALLDAELPGVELSQLIASARGAAGGQRCPLVVLSDEPAEDWAAHIREAMIDDLIPRSTTNPHWRIRLEIILHTCHRMRDLDQLREATALSAQQDPLTRVFNRSTLLSMLFRETDRMQRMKTQLCLLLFDIDDFGHWNTRLGTEACDELLCQVTDRVGHLLRSYDLLGRTGKDEFLTILPGCSTVDAILLAERLRMEIFATPFHVAGEAIRLSACFGIASSEGRSPVVVLREAELALHQAKEIGPESIQCFGSGPQSAEPVAFLSPSTGDELLAW
ncbi:MAG TPA: GGDEF domain-containing protein [Terracidiphilus sp.]|nr:GGDEF domain-containing protein [Terracidiphilus sp.]